MFMPMYAIPPYPIEMSGTGELCPSSELSGLSGDPFGITDLATAIVGWQNAKNAQKIQEEQLKAQIQAQRAQQQLDAKNFALTSAQSAVAPAEKARNATLYSLAAVGGVAAIIGTAFLFSAMKGKKR